MSTKLSLADVNAMTPQAYGAAFGRVFEHSPWIAERAFAKRPFSSVTALHSAMVEVVRGASHAEQLALLRSHPELAGKEAQSQRLTAESTHEQQQAGLTALSKDEMARISALNQVHAAKFGFPFIIAARLNTKAVIFAELERRAKLDPAAEFQACLDQVFLITGLRINDLID